MNLKTFPTGSCWSSWKVSFGLIRLDKCGCDGKREWKACFWCDYLIILSRRKSNKSLSVDDELLSFFNYVRRASTFNFFFCRLCRFFPLTKFFDFPFPNKRSPRRKFQIKTVRFWWERKAKREVHELSHSSRLKVHHMSLSWSRKKISSL